MANIEVKDFKSYLGDTLKKIYTVNSIDIGGTNSDGVKYHFNINDQFESDMPFNTRFSPI